MSLNIALDNDIYFPRLQVSGTYNTEPDDIDVTLQYAVSDTEPTSWEDVPSAVMADGIFSFTAPSLQDDESSILWVRLKCGNIYSEPVSANIYKYANAKYVADGGCYIFMLEGGQRMLAYDLTSGSIIMTDFSEGYQSNYHYIQVVGFGDATPFPSYNTCKKGKLKVYSQNKFIRYNSDESSFTLVSIEEAATEFNFYTDWGYASGTEFTVDLYVNGLQYLQAGTGDSKPSFGAIDYDTYKWRLIPVPTP